MPMRKFDDIQREHVLAAIQECVDTGQSEFLEKYGFGKSIRYVLSENRIEKGGRYSSKAILGVARKYARPELGALTNSEFSGGMRVTVKKLRELEFDVKDTMKPSDNKSPQVEMKNHSANAFHSLNTIIYGPPGTGKTYATARRCVEICDGRARGSDEDIRRRYDELVVEGRVEFITFHQSYGYEEFVEGLRPDTGGPEKTAEDTAGFRLVPTDGVLKLVAQRARKGSRQADAFDFARRKIFKMGLGNPDSPKDQWVFGECIRNGYMLLGYGDDVDWSDPRYDDKTEILKRWKIEEKDADHRTATVKYMNIFRNTMQDSDIVVVPDGLDRFRALGVIEGGYEFVQQQERGHYHHRRVVRWHWHDEDGMPVSDIQDVRFGRGTIHTLNSTRIERDNLRGLFESVAEPKRPQPYVLVIDEINRANVSKVMGELVTLLEDDKREGKLNEVAVTLPHSRRRFTLPANLYILGTMNTADRSIALLDTALRRRFDFEELSPDTLKLSAAAAKTGIDLPNVLRSMNERLEWLIDRDHLIGHAWLMGAKSKAEVGRIMRRKIIPLIAEYFYDDWEKVRAVLGETGDFVKREPLATPPGLEESGEIRYRWTVRKRFEDGAYERLIRGGTLASETEAE